LIDIVIILTPWHTDLEELIILRLSRNTASLADPETSLPRFYSPSLARLIHSTHLHFISLRTVLILPTSLRLDLLRGFVISEFPNNFCIGFSSILCVLNTYLFTPWSRVLLEKLSGSQLVKNFPPFCGTRMFITAFT